VGRNEEWDRRDPGSRLERKQEAGFLEGPNSAVARARPLVTTLGWGGSRVLRLPPSDEERYFLSEIVVFRSVPSPRST
jgi:hypothetical protein